MNVQDIAIMFTEDFSNRAFRTNARNYVDPNISVYDSGTGMQLQGLDAYLAYCEGWIAALPDARAEIVDAHADGNHVTLTIRGSGNFTGEMATPDGTIPGNGSRLDMDFEQEFEIRNGKVVKFALNYDMQEFLRQLGLA